MKNIHDQFWAIPKDVMALKTLSLQSRVIYGILWTRMNGENLAWPGHKSIANDLGIGERSISRYLDELKNEGLIEVTRRGLGRSNTYSIPAKLADQDMPPVSNQEPPTMSNPSMKRTYRKESMNSAPGGAEGEMIDLFKSVNPSYKILFLRMNQHKAIRRMIDEHGEEKLKAIITFLPRNNATPYAPKITTPMQLEEKMGQLIAHWQQEKQKSKPTKIGVV